MLIAKLAVKFDELLEIAPPMIMVSATPGAFEHEHSQCTVEMIVRPTGLVDPEIIVRPVSSQVDDLLSEINLCTVHGEWVLVTTLTKRMVREYL